jgi:hypothetical protein
MIMRRAAVYQTEIWFCLLFYIFASRYVLRTIYFRNEGVYNKKRHQRDAADSARCGAFAIFNGHKIFAMLGNDLNKGVNYSAL